MGQTSTSTSHLVLEGLLAGGQGVHPQVGHGGHSRPGERAKLNLQQHLLNTAWWPRVLLYTQAVFHTARPQSYPNPPSFSAVHPIYSFLCWHVPSHPGKSYTAIPQPPDTRETAEWGWKGKGFRDYGQEGRWEGRDEIRETAETPLGAVGQGHLPGPAGRARSRALGASVPGTGWLTLSLLD